MKRPDDIAGESEHSQQAAFILWCRTSASFGIESCDRWCEGGKLPKYVGHKFYPLKWLYSNANGEARGDSAKTAAIRGSRLKAEGVQKGVHDTFWPYPVYPYHGLYIEFKRPSIKPKKKGGLGGMKPEQIEFANYVVDMGYAFAVVYHWKEAREVTLNYLSLNKKD